jgi:NDP-4-keto-2,6-dideoxyhexose 3-C-methyltransferase
MKCRSCGSGLLTRVLDLGRQRLSDFPTPQELADMPAGTVPSFPLALVVCASCTLVQLEETTPRDLLYHPRYGFRSGTNEAVRDDLRDVVAYALSVVPDVRTWLDIACNDGTLLSQVHGKVWKVGVDPLPQMARDARRYADRVVSDYFGPDLRHVGNTSWDVITSVSMFYDLDDPNAFVAGIRDVLAPSGAWVVQQNYALDMVNVRAVDNICHEHVAYWSVTSMITLLEQHGLEVNDVTYSSVNGGCFRMLVSHRHARPVSVSVAQAVNREADAGIWNPETWFEWARTVEAELGILRNFLRSAAQWSKTVDLYGASTRGGTFLQMVGAGPDVLRQAVERSPDKVGKVMASIGLPIVSEEAMRADPPDYLLVSPWFFRDVFLVRERAYLESGGTMVFPLPEFAMVTGAGRS